MIEKWYYLDEKKGEKDRQQGPFPLYMMELWAHKGVITPQTLVWHPDLPHWTPWGEVAPVEKSLDETIEKEVVGSVEIPEVEISPAETSAPPEDNHRYAAAGLRLAALLIDLLVLGVVNAILLLIYTMVFRIPEKTLMESNLIHLPSLVLDACYQIWFLWRYGGTPGKMLVGLKVITAAGENLSLGRAIVRYFGFLLSAATMGMGFVMILLDPKRRALHDHLAKTRVVHSFHETNYGR